MLSAAMHAVLNGSLHIVQYISGRFATGYRATIGTDFITKTLPHYSQAKSATSAVTDPSSSSSAPTPPTDPVTLQIWDTAGQERFSSLSAAFFRGADAVIMVFDVNKPETLQDLSRWWDEFRVKVPIADGEEHNFCAVVVGNKMDMAPMTRRAGKEVVGPKAAVAFLSKTIPVPGREDTADDQQDTTETTEQPASSVAAPPVKSSSLTATRPQLPISQPSTSSSATATPRAEASKSPATKFGTMTSTRTGISIYHTPSSSLFESPAQSTKGESSTHPPSELSESPIALTHRSKRSESKVRYALPDDDEDSDDLAGPMDLEFDYNYEVNTASSSMSGYATAKSQPFSSSDSSVGNRLSRVGSVASESSMTTLRPPNVTPAINFRNRVIEERNLFASPSPSRSRKSSASSLAQGHNMATADLPTPSASPPSPPILTASLMAAVHMQQQQQQALNDADRPLDVGPRLFFTSAKTNSDTPIAEIFAYVAERVVRRWEWEESRDASIVDGLDADDATIRRRSGFRVRLGDMWNNMTTSQSGGCC